MSAKPGLELTNFPTLKYFLNAFKKTLDSAYSWAYCEVVERVQFLKEARYDD